MPKNNPPASSARTIRGSSSWRHLCNSQLAFWQVPGGCHLVMLRGSLHGHPEKGREILTMDHEFRSGRQGQQVARINDIGPLLPPHTHVALCATPSVRTSASRCSLATSADGYICATTPWCNTRISPDGSGCFGLVHGGAFMLRARSSTALPGA